MHLVHQQQPPLPVLEVLQHELGVVRALPAVREHVVRGHEDTGLLVRHLLGAGCELGDALLRDVRPHAELVVPLLHRHGRVAQHEARALDRARGDDAHERLARAARQHDDA